MKRSILKAIFSVVLACIFPLGLLTHAAGLPKMYKETYYEELSNMHTRIKETKNRKIVIIGGSNVAFGIDVTQLEKDLPGYTVCPFGLYAAVGTSAMLSLSEKYINEGDIVVLAIEPSSDTFSSYFGANAFLKCAESDKSLLTDLSQKQKEAVVGSYYDYLCERLAIKKSGIFPKAERVYSASSFDENCNMTFLRAGNNMALGFDSGALVDFSKVKVEKALADQINEYIKNAAKKGANVYISFSPVNREAVVGDDSGIELFYDEISSKLDAKIISNPNNYIYDSCWFYDNNFHLNTDGAKIRSHQLSCDILAELGIYKEPDFTEPSQPASIYVQKETEETSLSAFYFEEYKGGYLITGLTDEGLKAESLVIPESISGKPVISFDKEMLTGAAVVELTIPSSLEYIPDEAYKNAGALARLVIKGTGEAPSLGDHPFDGNDELKIYVPREAYGLYRDGAGCVENKWQNYLERIVTY